MSDKQDNRKYFSFCINSEKEPHLCEFLSDFQGNRSEFLANLVRNYVDNMNNEKDDSCGTVETSDSNASILAQSLDNNSQIIGQLGQLIGQLTNVLSSGIVVQGNVANNIVEQEIVCDEEDIEEDDESMKHNPIEVNENLLGDIMFD